MDSLSAINELHEALRTARQQLRAPLHRIISYAELVSEDENGLFSVQINHLVLDLRRFCDVMLDNIRSSFEGMEVLRNGDLKGIRTSLLKECPRLTQLVTSLREQAPADLAVAGREETVRDDIEKIARAAAAFEDSVKSLTLTAAKSTSKVVPQGDEKLEETRGGNGLISQIEYKGLLLVVDDDEDNRNVLSRRLLRDSYEVMFAESGKHALRILERYDFDLVLLDIMMPEMDGMEVLAEMKRRPKLSRIPVIMITAVDEIETIAHCIESGADDYLPKPFNAILLRARISALLERKRFQDSQERRRSELETILEESRRQKEKAESLLLNILPPLIAQELQESGLVRPMYFEDVSIVFVDIVGFTRSTEDMPADELVEVLNEHFTACDKIILRRGLEKLKTIGDCYMFAGGIPVRSPSHPVDCVLAALDIIHAMSDLVQRKEVSWSLRVGIHTGPVIAGVVGANKFTFDIWGESVNLAKRIESAGAADRINLSSATFTRVKDFFACERRGSVRIKEGKDVEMFFVNGIATGLLEKKNMNGIEAFRTRYATYFRSDLRAFPEYLVELSTPVENGGLL